MKKKKGYSLGWVIALAVVFCLTCVGGVWIYKACSSGGGMRVDPPSQNPGANQDPGANVQKNPGGNPEIPIGSASATGPSGSQGPGGDSGVSAPVRQRKSEFYNILVVGRDVKGSNTDVLMVCSYDKPSGAVTLMQIPRDTYVEDPINEGKSKRINALYAFAYNYAGSIGVPYKDQQQYALDYLEGAVERTFGLEIDRYVYVDLKAFRDIVDIIGGVTVNVPQNMDYEDPDQNLFIHIKKGTQRLNGKQAEGFVRYRYGYLDGDLGRLDAQKLFLSALMDQLLDAKNIGKIPQLMNSVYTHLLTDLSLDDLIYLVSSAGGIDSAKIKMITAPGKAFQSQSGAWYYSLYAEDNLRLVNESFNCYTTDITAADMDLVQLIAKK